MVTAGVRGCKPLDSFIEVDNPFVLRGGAIIDSMPLGPRGQTAQPTEVTYIMASMNVSHLWPLSARGCRQERVPVFLVQRRARARQGANNSRRPSLGEHGLSHRSFGVPCPKPNVGRFIEAIVQRPPGSAARIDELPVVVLVQVCTNHFPSDPLQSCKECRNRACDIRPRESSHAHYTLMELHGPA